VLVADDNAALAGMLDTWLTAAGHTVRYAASGDEAAGKLAERVPDALVTDILMTSGNGVELIQYARTLHPRPRIIAMSGGSQMMGVTECLEIARNAGADLCLPKPFSPQELLDALQDLAG
jgi:CheY-like chemotaxis protein